MELGGHIAVFDDGACNELGEHDDVSAKINDVVLGLDLPAVDVDGVGKGLEGVKADAKRQGADALDGRKACPQQGVGAGEDEVCVFEVEQHPQAADKARQQEGFAGGLALVKAFQPQAAKVVQGDEGQHDGEEPHLAPAVKHQTAHKQHGVFELCGRQIIQRQRNGQETE